MHSHADQARARRRYSAGSYIELEGVFDERAEELASRFDEELAGNGYLDADDVVEAFRGYGVSNSFRSRWFDADHSGPVVTYRVDELVLGEEADPLNVVFRNVKYVLVTRRIEPRIYSLSRYIFRDGFDHIGFIARLMLAIRDYADVAWLVRTALRRRSMDTYAAAMKAVKEYTYGYAEKALKGDRGAAEELERLAREFEKRGILHLIML